jgi:hypothetical protein
MDLAPWIEELARSANGGTDRSEEEVALREGAALLGAVVGAVLLGVLHVVDAVVEAWPLPTSRVRR